MLQPMLKPQQPPQRVILSVTELNKSAKACLEANLGSVWIKGEISNFTKAASGHCYFSLKDSQAQVRCAMFRFKTQALQFSPQEGDEVVVKAKVSLYEARGDYQLIADFMEPAGLGDLQQKLRVLMQKLSEQGYFDQNRKKALPQYPKAIGVVTSPTGAAIHDVLTVLARRSPMTPVVIYPTLVQGTQAADSIINKLQTAIQRNEVDVIVLTRGGGSLEDLWSFNDERLAQVILNSPIPIVAAIGHEVDTTIAELVADLRAATPSAAAELVSIDVESLRQKLDQIRSQLTQSVESILKQRQYQLKQTALKITDPKLALLTQQNKLERLLNQLVKAIKEKIQADTKHLVYSSKKLAQVNPINQLNQDLRKLASIENRLFSSIKTQLNNNAAALGVAVGKLDTLSPLSTLQRGYAIVKDKQTSKVINRIEQTKVNQTLEVMLSNGSIDCEVKRN
ncbi:exodeoxyribonuclease VII large subunit [Aliikangiella sp. IMCC44632]